MPHAVILFVAATGVAVTAAAQEPVKPSPHLSMFAPCIGTWTVEVVYKPAALTPDGHRFTETKTSEWILDGHFLQETVHTESHDAKILFGYDSNKQVLRSWYFRSDGSTSAFSGTWDEEAKTINWQSADGQMVAQTVFRSVTEDNYQLSLIVKDKSGQLLMHAEADHQRRKDSN